MALAQKFDRSILSSDWADCRVWGVPLSYMFQSYCNHSDHCQNHQQNLEYAPDGESDSVKICPAWQPNTHMTRLRLGRFFCTL
jgi:hypothetical protein